MFLRSFGVYHDHTLKSQDHSIPLLEHVIVVKVKPYRYSFSQKAEIERMVTKMLEEGLIQPSTSPFLAPILLVHKKDGL